MIGDGLSSPLGKAFNAFPFNVPSTHIILFLNDGQEITI